MKTFKGIEKIILINVGLFCYANVFSQTHSGETSIINVRQYGAIGDGHNDDTKSIQAAINKAKNQKATVYFPSGVYMVTRLEVKANLQGAPNTTIKNIDQNKLSKYTFCIVKSQNSLQISNLIFDGAVKTNAKYVPIAGSIPLFIYGSKNICIVNCTFQNSAESGLRIESSDSIQVDNCLAKRSIGNFGDGFYFNNCHYVSINNCTSNDYTRIGFVAEKKSSNMIFKDCTAKNGHDASILIKGTEYNAGFWYENSANIITKSCTATSNTHYGFVATSGIQASSIPSVTYITYVFDNCVSNYNPIGFQLSSKDIAVKMTLNSCKVNYAVRGYVATAQNKEDEFEFNGCKVSLKPLKSQSSNTIGFMWESPVSRQKEVNTNELPIFSYNNCYVQYLEPINMNKLLNNNNNNGDISTYTGGKAYINVENLQNSLPKGEAVIKARTGNPIYNLKKTKADTQFIKRKEN